MLSSRRLADLVTMVLVAIPLFGCGDAVTADARDSRQSRTASGALSHTSVDVGEAQDFTPEDAAMMNRISRIEGRHFDLYRHYRGIAARQMRVDTDADDEVDDDNADGALRQAVLSFSASSLSQALSACSMRALMALD